MSWQEAQDTESAGPMKGPEARWKIEERQLSCEDALFLNYLDLEMEAKRFAYLVQTQKKEC